MKADVKEVLYVGLLSGWHQVGGGGEGGKGASAPPPPPTDTASPYNLLRVGVTLTFTFPLSQNYMEVGGISVHDLTVR